MLKKYLWYFSPGKFGSIQNVCKIPLNMQIRLKG